MPIGTERVDRVLTVVRFGAGSAAASRDERKVREQDRPVFWLERFSIEEIREMTRAIWPELLA